MQNVWLCLLKICSLLMYIDIIWWHIRSLIWPSKICSLLKFIFIFHLFFNLSNFNVKIGTSNKRTWGPTRCLQIHAINIEDRPKDILDKDGEPVGLNDKVVFDLSYFFGTLARNSDLCNFKALLKDYKKRIWKYVMVIKQNSYFWLNYKIFMHVFICGFV